MNNVLFFRSPGHVRQVPRPMPHDLSPEVWRPDLLRMRAPGLSLGNSAVWWLFHHARIFRNREFAVCAFRRKASVVHRSCVFPPYFRFPFMQDADIQVGDIWTADSERGRGLAAAMLSHVLASYPGRNAWFLCDEQNEASARLARGAGFELFGRGARQSRGGVRAFGAFVLNERTGAPL